MAHIAFLLPDMRGGGAERVALTLIEAFIELGHEVDLVLMKQEGELFDQVPSEVTLVDLSADRIRNVLVPLIRYLRERRPAALQVSLWPLTVIALLAARLSGIGARLVTSDHAMLSKQYGGSLLRRATLRISSRFFYPFADACVCVSAACADDLASVSGLPRDSISVIHNPVSLPPRQISFSPKVEALWPVGAKRILSVGTLKPIKNHDLLIQAFARISRESDACLMILGDGPLRSDLEEQAKALGIPDRVIMPGFVADPFPYYGSANLFVLSSDSEGFGNVLVEALHAGLPIVSTECPGGPHEILDGGRFGYLVPVGDDLALATAISDALAKPHDPGPGRDWALQLTGDSVRLYAKLLLGQTSDIGQRHAGGRPPKDSS
jgi:glycosyltransferase involved in cell wall biosynthesis